MLKNILIFSSVALFLLFVGYYAGRGGVDHEQVQQGTTNALVENKKSNVVKTEKRKKFSNTNETVGVAKELPLENKEDDGAIKKLAQSERKNKPVVEAEPVGKTQEKRSPKDELILSMREAGLPESHIEGAVMGLFPETEVTEGLEEEAIIKKEQLMSELNASGMPAEDAEIMVSGLSPTDLVKVETGRSEMTAEEKKEDFLASLTEAGVPDEDIDVIAEGQENSQKQTVTQEEIKREEELRNSLTEAGVPEEEIEIMVEGMMGKIE